MNERKSIAGVIIPIILIIIFIMCAIVYCIFFMNKQTTNPINNEISNIDNSSTKNNNVVNTVSEFTMTESEFPKVWRNSNASDDRRDYKVCFKLFG